MSISSSSSLFFESSNENLKQVNVVCSSNERHVYEKKSVFFVHPLFNGESEWPMSTDICCYYDGEKFDGIPIPIPLNYIHERNKYICFGIFCSASCAKAYMDASPVYSNSLSMMWLKKIMCEVFNDHSDIVAAPSQTLLIRFGGELTIEEFRKFGKQQINIFTHSLPFFTCALAFELVKEYGNKPKTVEQEGREIKKLKRNQKRKQDAVISTPVQSANVNATVNAATVNSTTVNATPVQSVIVQPVQPPPILRSEEKDIISNADASISPTSLLPEGMIMVPADVGNKWGIRGLKKPSEEIEMQWSQQSTTKSLFQEYLETKTAEKLNAASGNKNVNITSLPSSISSSHDEMSSSINNTTSTSNSNPTSTSTSNSVSTSTLSTSDTTIATATDINSQIPKIIKRRGRPKIQKKESPKLAPRGSLTMFLKSPKEKKAHGSSTTGSSTTRPPPRPP